ncbi:hypothetical protein ACIBCM_33515 [Streptomyces sp. NPDC051018]|uniref:hypothetical protein n=1 Tax=Streptomyces sp. NPDC051018 TaxID=3365639 RepID=UPI0037B47858
MKRLLSPGAAFLTSVACAAAVLFAPGTAQAVPTWEEDWITLASDRNCDYIATAPNSGASTVCFEKNGDKLWVKSFDSLNARISMQWWNEIRTASGWELHRHGECFNDSGQHALGSCNKDFYEHSTVRPDGGHGSRIRFKACRLGTCSGVTPWINNDA